MTANNPAENIGLGAKDLMGKPTPTKTPDKQKSSESRKIRKPLMEKKRRARINQSLNELKRILLEANGTPGRKEGSRPAKLEKADILELTVRHLQNLQKTSSKVLPPRVPVTSSTTSDIEMDEESSSSSNISFDPDNSKSEKVSASPAMIEQQLTRILDICPSGQIFDPTTPTTHALHRNNTYLIPTRLSNGDIAFVVKRQGSKNPNSIEIKCEEQSDPEHGIDEDNFKNPSRLNDNSNHAYLQHTIISSRCVIWRPW